MLSSPMQFRRLVLCFTLAGIFMPAARAAQDVTRADNVLPATRSNLIDLHWPDLRNLEPEVREQLLSLRSSLVASVRNSNSTDSQMADAYGNVGEIYQAYSLNAPARECYFNAGQLTPHDFRWVYLLARLDQLEDRTQDAIGRYQLARKMRPDYVAAPVNLGNIYLQMNRLAEAKESFTAAQTIDAKCAAALYGLGQVALSQRSYAEAADYFEKALALIPVATRIHYSLAMAYRGMGDREKAAAHLARQGSVGVRPNDPLFDGLQDLLKGERIHLIRGKLALESSSFAEAAAEFRKALAANHDSVPAHVNLGGVLIQLGDLKGATEQFNEALSIDPQNGNAHYNLAFLLARANQHEAAIVHLRSVLTIDPTDLNARFFLAQELMQATRTEDALAEFSRLAELDPNNEDALLQQVKLLQQTKRYREALDHLKRAHAHYPQKGRTAATLAYLLAASPQYDLRDGAQALVLAQTVYHSTSSFEHGALVAMALGELGRCPEAAEWLKRMIAVAEKEQKPEMVAKLSAELKQYERQPCRPGD